MTPAEQRNFYDTFGFVILKQAFSRSEIDQIGAAYDETMNQGMAEAGKNRQQLDASYAVDPGFCERHPVLRALVDDPRIAKSVDNLFEPGWFYKSSDGHLYVGDTLWHSDTGWCPTIPLGRDDPNRDQMPAHYFPGMKVALYLDPVENYTGCLRVIPGSHISPYHESLASLHNAISQQAPELLLDPNFKQFGLEPSEAPSYPIESEPGDVVMFHSMCWHASFGGKLRRMFSIWYQSGGENDKQRKYAESMKRHTESIAAKFS